jgi:hypothetical protein
MIVILLMTCGIIKLAIPSETGSAFASLVVKKFFLQLNKTEATLH